MDRMLFNAGGIQCFGGYDIQVGLLVTVALFQCFGGIWCADVGY